MSIPIAILNAQLPAQEGKFFFRIPQGHSVSTDDMANMISSRLAIQVGTVSAVINTYQQILTELLLEGKAAALGQVCYFYISAEGVIDRPDASIRDNATLQLSMIPHKGFLKDLRDAAQFERVTLSPRQPVINFLSLTQSDLLDVIAPPKVMVLHGDNLSFADNDQEGLFIQENSEEAMSIRITDYSRAGEKLIEFVWPEEVKVISPYGWKISVKTSYGNKTTGLRITTYSKVLWRQPLLSDAVWPTNYAGRTGRSTIAAFKERQTDGSIKVKMYYRAFGDVTEGTHVEIVEGVTEYVLYSNTSQNTLTMFMAETDRQKLMVAIPDPGNTPGDFQTITENFMVR